MISATVKSLHNFQLTKKPKKEAVITMTASNISTQPDRVGIQGRLADPGGLVPLWAVHREEFPLAGLLQGQGFRNKMDFL